MSGSVPVFINTRDRVGCLRTLLDWCTRAGLQDIVIVDNASTYEPLLDFFRHTPHEVVRLKDNLGHLAPWLSGAIEARVGSGGRFVETDPDVVPQEDCPLDALDRFDELLGRHPETIKVGFGLRIDDLPRRYRHAAVVRRWEARFWTDEVEPDVYRAPIDTTFALYREGTPVGMEPALRTGGRYRARHLPWYLDSRHPSAEQQYYLDHITPGVNSWDGAVVSDHIATYGRESSARRSILHRLRGPARRRS